jgi:ADP-heptose:LPS heptosyltransferase
MMRIKNKIKSLVIKLRLFKEFSFFWLVYACIPSKKYYLNNSLVIVRIDAIGDYVLFRNFIELLKNHESYKNYNITLIGNSAWKELALELDSQFIQNFIWISPIKFKKNLLYRSSILKQLKTLSCEMLLCPTYSRDLTQDFVVKSICAKEKIGSSGDLNNTQALLKFITDKWYTTLIPAQINILFEFERNREFFEYLCKKHINLKKPVITYIGKKDFFIKKPYAILFIGASISFRQWSMRNFSAVARYLYENHKLQIVLCGGEGDLPQAALFETLYKHTFENYVGKTSLVDLLDLIKNSTIIVSNESSLPHLSMALGTTPTIVVYSGNNFGRFTPYPRELNLPYYAIYHPEIENSLEQYMIDSNQEYYRNNLNINDIKSDACIKIIDLLLNKSIHLAIP